MSDYLHVRLGEAELNSLSTLALAHVGDGVYELMVRAWIVSRGRLTAAGLHRDKIRYVSAAAQAKALESIKPVLTEEEAAVCRRGRNAHVHSLPKNAQPMDYHDATALEALFGWLYLRGEYGRLNALFTAMMDDGE